MYYMQVQYAGYAEVYRARQIGDVQLLETLMSGDASEAILLENVQGDRHGQRRSSPVRCHFAIRACFSTRDAARLDANGNLRQRAMKAEPR